MQGCRFARRIGYDAAMDTRPKQWPALFAACGTIVFLIYGVFVAMRSHEPLDDACAKILAEGLMGGAIGWLIGKAFEVFASNRDQ